MATRKNAKAPAKKGHNSKRKSETEKLVALGRAYYVPCYKQRPIILDRAKGSRIWDLDGKDYIDFGAGIAVCALGYGDKYVPSVDRLFESAAKHFGAELLAVVLTGMGDDGRKGVLAVKGCGGSVVAESESTAVIFGMPQQAIRTGAVDAVLPLGEVATAIQRGVRRAKMWEVSRKGSV